MGAVKFTPRGPKEGENDRYVDTFKCRYIKRSLLKPLVRDQKRELVPRHALGIPNCHRVQ